jgi:2-methylisocitrate lyase-like PEP mutase family enzyme
MTKKSKVLRQLLQKKKPFFLPGAYNAMVARVIEQVGFDAVYMTGYGTSLGLLGMPDAGLITLSEMVMNARYINNAVSIPVLADGDTGFGNAINVRRTIREFIQAGIAGVHLEDQVLPKRCGHIAGKELISLKEAAGKFRAASDIREELDPDFLIIARTDARTAHGGGIEEAIERSNAYLESGADVAFVEAIATEEEIGRFCEEIRGPILYNYSGASPRLSLKKLGELGVSIVIMPGATMRVTVKEVYDFLAGVKGEGLLYEARWQEEFQENHPLGDFHVFSGFPKIRRLEALYLPEEDAEKYRDSMGFQP